MHTSSRTRRGQAATVWRRRIRQQQAGGLSVRAFCHVNGCRESLFYYWRVRLGLRPDVELKHTRDLAGASSPAGQTPGFARAVVRPDGGSRAGRGRGDIHPVIVPTPAILLRLRGGRELLLPAGMAPVHLAQLVAALEALPDQGDPGDPGKTALRVREDGGVA
jgi:hypothetical protein